MPRVMKYRGITRDTDMELLDKREDNMLRALGLLLHLKNATMIDEHLKGEISEVVGCITGELYIIGKSIDVLTAKKKRLGSTREKTKITIELINKTRARLQKARPHNRITQSDIAADLDVTRKTVSRVEKNNKKIK